LGDVMNLSLSACRAAWDVTAAAATSGGTPVESTAGGTRHSDGHERASFDLRPVAFELQPGQSSGREPTFDRTDSLGCRGGRVSQFVYHSRRARGVADEQGNLAIFWKFAYRIDQRIGAGVVETIGDLHPVPIDLIIQFEQVECLPGPGSARAQHGIDCDALAAQVIPDILRVELAVRGEPSLAVLAARSCVFGLRVAQYEQRASLVHSFSVSTLSSGVACRDRSLVREGQARLPTLPPGVARPSRA
jgi:hypothetical protein